MSQIFHVGPILYFVKKRETLYHFLLLNFFRFHKIKTRAKVKIFF